MNAVSRFVPALCVLVMSAAVASGAPGEIRLILECSSASASPDAQSVAIGPDGTMYTANYMASQVIHYGSGGGVLGAWALGTGPAGLPCWPWGIAVDAAGDVFVSDCANRCVYKYLADGERVATLGSGVLVAPRGVAWDRETGHLFVCDGQGRAIREFGTDDTLVRSVPADWYVSDVEVGGQGVLFVSAYNGRVYRFEADGTVSVTWQPADASPSTSFFALAKDPGGRVHVVDRGGSRVLVLDNMLEPIGQWQLDCVSALAACQSGPEGYNAPFLTGIDISEGAAVLSADCQSGEIVLLQQAPVPVRPPTWGALKALYR